MTRIYRITSSAQWLTNHPYEISPSCAWILPGLSCPVCKDTWATVGFHYPWISLEDLPEVRSFNDPWPAPLEQWLRLKTILQAYIKDNIPLSPGSWFGPTSGKFAGTSGDIAWAGDWQLFMSKDLISQLKRIHFPKLVKANFHYAQGAKSREYFEIGIEHFAKMPSSALEVTEECICGAQEVILKDMVLEIDSIPDADFFRAVNAPTFIFVKEHVMKDILSLGSADILFQPVKLSK